MKRFNLVLVVLMAFFLISSSSYAVVTNVALNADVQLQGASFFTNGWGNSWLTSADTIVDGLFLQKGNQWDQGTVWWDLHDEQDRYIEIDLDDVYLIESFVVQADDNDAYKLYYRDLDTDTWVLAWDIPTSPSWGMQTRPNSLDDTERHILATPIMTNALLFKGNMSHTDKYFSVSEIQAYGKQVPPVVCGNGLSLSANVWTMFSAPCIPPSGSATVNDQLNGDLGTGAAYDLTWFMFRWNSVTESYEQVQATDPLEQGVGYWIYSKQAGTLKIDNGTHTTEGAAPVSGEDGYYEDCSDYGWIGQPCYKIDLTPPTLAEGTKWNLIGYPFVRNTDWAAVHVAYSENNGATWLDAGTPSAADTSGYISKNGYVYNNSGSAYNVFDDTVSSPSPGILQPNKSYWIMSRFVSGVTNLALLAPAPSL
jgi:hypothetical protein